MKIGLQAFRAIKFYLYALTEPDKKLIGARRKKSSSSRGENCLVAGIKCIITNNSAFKLVTEGAAHFPPPRVNYNNTFGNRAICIEF